MNILLDTNALLWLLSDDDKLNKNARQTISDAANIAISEVSLWEITIKISISKLRPIPELPIVLQELGFKRLSIKDEYLTRYETLPLLHRDPFDRMLVAQAAVDNLTLITSDTFLKDYGIKVIKA